MDIRSKKDFMKYKHIILPKAKSKILKEDFSGKSKSIFVGEYGYPNVGVGVLAAENYKHNDDQKYWLKENWSLSQIAEARLDLLQSKRGYDVKTPEILETQEIALASRPTDVELRQEVSSRKNFSYSPFHKPMGPSAKLQEFKLLSNPRIPSRVDRVVSDTDLKANEGVGALYKKGIESDYLTQIFSSGSLGISDSRKLVPTKWSITAVDDIVGKQLLAVVKNFQTTGNFVYQGGYMGNYFLILFFDGPLSYELFEFFRDSPLPTTDYEDWNGRKKYAVDTAGGYYAIRLPVLEKMRSLKRQSQALVLRFITDEYYMPLGSWVPKQGTAATLHEKCIEFGSEELMIKYAKGFSKKKFGRDISKNLQESLLVRNRAQRTVANFF
jgi:hypothetical protein